MSFVADQYALVKSEEDLEELMKVTDFKKGRVKLQLKKVNLDSCFLVWGQLQLFWGTMRK